MSLSPRSPRLLWLLRHAKTEQDPPAGGGDYERRLTARGRRDADALGVRLGSGGDRLGFGAPDLPTLILCSAAKRTEQTAERVLVDLRPVPEISHLRVLYGASPAEVVRQLQLVDDDVGSVMVVGHNPTAHTLAATLPSAGDRSGRDQVEASGFPTCSLAVYEFPAAHWSEVEDGTGTLVGLFTPPF